MEKVDEDFFYEAFIYRFWILVILGLVTLCFAHVVSFFHLKHACINLGTEKNETFIKNYFCF